MAISLPVILLTGLCCVIIYFLFYLLPLGIRFRWQVIQNLLLNLILISVGLVVTWNNDVRNNDSWFGHHYHDSDLMVVKIAEPLVEKAKSFKANAFVEAVIHHDSVINCKGKILVYFSKDSISSRLGYGDRMLINKKLQRIKNSGNPGAFNYQRYAAFQQIYHNVFLKEKDWVMLPDKSIDPFRQFIFNARENMLSLLRKNMDSSKDELGIAQALLIGYTNDLDKDLVQAYSNTGVVHIIAISGMHLGLIYLLLVSVFKKIPGIRKSRLLQAALILCCLWLFSLLTGASASVLRAAVMFTFITIGSSFNKQASIYNSLAASAFVLLCYNPYFLWDVGFQLSYLAVVSIVVFQVPVYNGWYLKNKWADHIWKLAAISLAAQILTFPICIYYFHQFPNFFLLTNLIVVPLSSIILYAEIGLVAFSWISWIGPVLGKTVSWLVWAMNKIVLYINAFPFAVWDGIAATVLSTWLLYAVVIGTCAWLMKRNHLLFQFALYALLLFAMTLAYSRWQITNQQKLIVYNVPQHRAIDIVQGNDYKFIGDSMLIQDGMLQNFHLKPARIMLQLTDTTSPFTNLYRQQSFFQFSNKRILLIDQTFLLKPSPLKTTLDIIIISKNPSLRIAQLAGVFNCSQYVFDASNSLWKIDKWQKECEELHLRSYSVQEKGAFVLDVGE